MAVSQTARGYGNPAVQAKKPFVGRNAAVMISLSTVLFGLCLLAAGVGAYRIPPSSILESIAQKAGVLSGAAPTELADSVLWNIRLPRVVLAVLVGAALSCAGAAMQGIFSNPLAEPGVVGVSSGAALGAVVSIVSGFSALGTWGLTLAAFLGGLTTVLIGYLASRSEGRTEVVTLILTGVGLNALIGALIGLALFFSNDDQLRSITFWTLGSMAQATWPKVAAVAPVAAIGISLAALRARDLDLLALGERSASHLGVDVQRLRACLLFVVALLTASAVAVSGVVVFVGLLVPHLVRMALGPSHRMLLAASALAGACLMVLADLTARTVAAPAELPLGVLTALAGTPVFFVLLRKTRRRHGGWA